MSLKRNEIGRHLQLYSFAHITNHLWYRLQRRGFMNYLELYRSAYITYICLYHQKSWVSLTKKRVGRHLQLWFVYITVSRRYRLKRREFMNYLEHYRSAYITYICLYHQQSWVSLTKKRVGRNLQLHWLVYITVSPWYRLQRRGFINYLELYKSAYISKSLGCR